MASFQINLGCRGFRKIGLHQTSCMKPFDVGFFCCFFSTSRLLQLFRRMPQHCSFDEYSKLGKHCVIPLFCPPAPNKMAGSLVMEYPWPVTQRWPEEVMSKENVPDPARQTDRHVGRASLFLPGISYHVSDVCPSRWNELKAPATSYLDRGLHKRLVSSLLPAIREADCWNKLIGQIVFPIRGRKAVPAWQCLRPKQDVPASRSFSFDHGLEGRWSPTSQPPRCRLTRTRTQTRTTHTHSKALK